MNTTVIVQNKVARRFWLTVYNSYKESVSDVLSSVQYFWFGILCVTNSKRHVACHVFFVKA